ncbi:MAG: glycine betaine ABC transporter substrate-binding protein, partial [Janthinobacterium sp.]
MNTITSKNTVFSTMRRAVLGTLVLGVALASSGSAFAQGKEVTIAYQEINGPFLVAIASGEVEKTTGYKINWRKFDSGAKVATGMASGDVQIGVIGSSPLTAAVSRGVDLQLFWIIDDINEA